MTENFRGDPSGVEAYCATPTNGVEGGFRLARGVAGVRTTGVGGSETSFNSANSNSSSKSAESVCHVVQEEGMAMGLSRDKRFYCEGRRFSFYQAISNIRLPFQLLGPHPSQRLTPSAPTCEFLDPDSIALTNDNNNSSKFSPSTAYPTGNRASASTPTGNHASSVTPTANNNVSMYFPASPLSPSKSSSVTPTVISREVPTSDSSPTPKQRFNNFRADSPTEATPTSGCAPDGGVDGDFSSASRRLDGGRGGVAGERPPTGGGVGESSPSPPATIASNNASSGRLKSMVLTWNNLSGKRENRKYGYS